MEFIEYLKANENITSASGKKWKLNIKWINYENTL